MGCLGKSFAYNCRLGPNPAGVPVFCDLISFRKDVIVDPKLEGQSHPNTVSSAPQWNWGVLHPGLFEFPLFPVLFVRRIFLPFVESRRADLVLAADLIDRLPRFVLGKDRQPSVRAEPRFFHDVHFLKVRKLLTNSLLLNGCPFGEGDRLDLG